MRVQELLSLDFTKLPDEIIDAIYAESHKEKSRRRRSRISTQSRTFKLLNRCHPIHSKHRQKVLKDLITDDWSSVYRAGESEKKFYVYAHVEKCKGGLRIDGIDFGGVPFYIGKGTGDRAYDLKRNEGHGAELRRLLSNGGKPDEIVRLIWTDLSEHEALCLEAKLIYFFGTRFDNDKNGVLVNLSKPATPYD